MKRSSGVILLLIFTCSLLNVGSERLLVRHEGANREIVAIPSFENKCGTRLVFFSFDIYVHDVTREFDLNDELVTLRLEVKTGEMDDVDAVNALEQEFVLCR